jgi:hypothetical protein
MAAGLPRKGNDVSDSRRAWVVGALLAAVVGCGYLALLPLLGSLVTGPTWPAPVATAGTTQVVRAAPVEAPRPALARPPAGRSGARPATATPRRSDVRPATPSPRPSERPASRESGPRLIRDRATPRRGPVTVAAVRPAPVTAAPRPGSGSAPAGRPAPVRERPATDARPAQVVTVEVPALAAPEPPAVEDDVTAGSGS